jgi:hypothetical protein
VDEGLVFTVFTEQNETEETGLIDVNPAHHGPIRFATMRGRARR